MKKLLTGIGFFTILIGASWTNNHAASMLTILLGCILLFIAEVKTSKK